jgi:hypothetical protein
MRLRHALAHRGDPRMVERCHPLSEHRRRHERRLDLDRPGRIVGVIIPHGVLFRGATEAEIRNGTVPAGSIAC